MLVDNAVYHTPVKDRKELTQETNGRKLAGNFWDAKIFGQLTGGQGRAKKSLSYAAHVRPVHHVMLENQLNLI